MEILSDTHIHSTYSFDGRSCAGDYARTACERGLQCICFTEHHNENENYPDYRRYIKYDEYFRETENLRLDYSGELLVLRGVEFDQPDEYQGALEELNELPLDVIIGSVHNAFDIYCGDPALFELYTLERVLEDYYRRTIISAQLGGFDVIGHFDLPMKKLRAKRPQVSLRSEALKAIAQAGIALEVNTGGLSSACGETLPDPATLEEFAALGGKRVTFGSDAHCAEDLAYGFEDIENIELFGLTPGVFINREFVPWREMKL